jgi:hypothetical protein
MQSSARLIALAMCLGAVAAPVAGGDAATTSPATAPETSAGPSAAVQAAHLEPKALAILKAMCDRLAAAKSMTFTAVVLYESPSAFGPALVYTTKSVVTMQRPDKLKVIQSADGPATEFYYDGKTMTAYAPAENLVASGPAPATIDATLEKAFDDAAIYYPFTDVIVADPYKDLSDGLQIAFYIGQSKVIDGTTTDMVAFANEAVFAQIWIGADDKLPRKLRAVYLNDPSKLRHDLNLFDWKFDPKIAANAFATPKAAGATKIAFARPDQMPAGMPPPKPPTPASAPQTGTPAPPALNVQ